MQGRKKGSFKSKEKHDDDGKRVLLRRSPGSLFVADFPDVLQFFCHFLTGFFLVRSLWSFLHLGVSVIMFHVTVYVFSVDFSCIFPIVCELLSFCVFVGRKQEPVPERRVRGVEHEAGRRHQMTVGAADSGDTPRMLRGEAEAKGAHPPDRPEASQPGDFPTWQEQQKRKQLAKCLQRRDRNGRKLFRKSLKLCTRTAPGP